MRPFGLVRMWQSWQRNGWRRQRSGPPGETGADSFVPGPKGDVGDASTVPGPMGPAGPSTLGEPVPRSIALGNVYQATNPDKPAMVTVNAGATNSISLSGGSINTAEVRIGDAAAGLAAGTSGNAVGRLSYQLSGSVVLGLNVTGSAVDNVSFALPAGWFFCVRQTAGVITIVSAFDQQVG